MIISFPKRIKHTKVIPFIDFYKKCMELSFNTSDIENISVSAFSVNIRDYNKLKKLVRVFYKKNYQFLSYKKREFEISMLCLDIGPRIGKQVKEGTVEIDEEKLYARA